ncbi:UNVERIFIED_CONTAM: hypothetical protein GTU68_006347 [Idotea baltica]|nr:hypothetical protein [Idotea baltica]
MNQSLPPDPEFLRPAATEKLAFVSSDTEEAREALEELSERYGNVPPQEADVIVALGGDGLMLQTLHAHMGSGKPIYGMNRGSVGFLMNEYRHNDLKERLSKADVTTIRPLEMTATTEDGNVHKALAINEVSLLRQTSQAARLRISVDGRVRLDELICDGIIVATPAGSTAYNLSAHGPFCPLMPSSWPSYADQRHARERRGRPSGRTDPGGHEIADASKPVSGHRTITRSGITHAPVKDDRPRPGKADHSMRSCVGTSIQLESSATMSLPLGFVIDRKRPVGMRRLARVGANTVSASQQSQRANQPI